MMGIVTVIILFAIAAQARLVDLRVIQRLPTAPQRFNARPEFYKLSSQHHGNSRDSIYSPKAAIGESCTEKDLQLASTDVSALTVGDVVAVKRSDGTWRYAKLLQRDAKLMKFQCDDAQSTKEIPSDKWKELVKDLNPSTAVLGRACSEDDLRRGSADVSGLASGDVVAVKRSDGMWRYAKLLERDTMIMKFLCDAEGSIKTIPRDMWNDLIKQLDPSIATDKDKEFEGGALTTLRPIESIDQDVQVERDVVQNEATATSLKSADVIADDILAKDDLLQNKELSTSVMPSKAINEASPSEWIKDWEARTGPGSAVATAASPSEWIKDWEARSSSASKVAEGTEDEAKQSELSKDVMETTTKSIVIDNDTTGSKVQPSRLKKMLRKLFLGDVNARFRDIFRRKPKELSQTSHYVISTPVASLIGGFIGSGLAFIITRRRPNHGEHGRPLLANVFVQSLERITSC